MAMFDWNRRGSPLQAAIQKGMRTGGSLAKEIRDLEDYKVRSRADAKAICAALETVAEVAIAGTSPRSFDSPLHALVALFQDVDGSDCPAYEVMASDGTALLVRILDQELEQPGRYAKNDVLFCLKVLAMYGSEAAVARLVQLARRPLAADDYMWSIALGAYNAEHPLTARVLAELSSPLPPDFIGVSLLDAANAALIGGAKLRHPFDSASGVERLRAWLLDSEPEHFSYAHSTTAALPFLRHPERDELLAAAMAHPSPGVGMEAAWAAGKLGRESGVQKLAVMARDVNHSEQARQYLTELNRADAIPQETLAPGFVARAEFARWLAHPNELGRPPDEVEVFDHRELAWPPTRERREMWLLRYRVKDTTGLSHDDLGVGLVGSTTFCLFSYDLHLRPPEDGYAIHCCWELEGDKLIKLDDVEDQHDEYRALLQQWHGPPLAEPRVTAVAEVDPSLELRQHVIAAADALVNGVSGFAVLDGSNSRWYPRDELPDGSSASIILKIHVGSRLLGFPAVGTRKEFLQTPAPIPPEQLVRAYERLLDELDDGDLRHRHELLHRGNSLQRSFMAYIDARAAAAPAARATAVIETYDRIFAGARSVEGLGKDGDELFDNFGVLGEQFETYVNALLILERRDRIREVVSFFAPRWEHNLGYGQLGAAAFNGGDHAAAERFLLRLKAGLENWERSEEIGLLAEIWHSRGERDAARDLILDALRRLVHASNSADPDDRRSFQGWFQTQRATFLRLLPEETPALAAAGIPESLRFP